MDDSQQLQRGETSTFVLNSLEHSFMPESVDLKSLAKLVKPNSVFEDFRHGIQDWSSRDQRSIKTYKFQNPELDRSNTKKLSLKINPQGKRLTLRLNASSKFLDRKDNLGDFSFTKNIQGDKPQEVVIDRSEFKSKDGNTLDWSKTATFTITIVDATTRQTVNLTTKEGQAILQRITMVD
jgi:hypothetical protein